jgi:hypothetical protein
MLVPYRTWNCARYVSSRSKAIGALVTRFQFRVWLERIQNMFMWLFSTVKTRANLGGLRCFFTKKKTVTRIWAGEDQTSWNLAALVQPQPVEQASFTTVEIVYCSTTLSNYDIINPLDFFGYFKRGYKMNFVIYTCLILFFPTRGLAPISITSGTETHKVSTRLRNGGEWDKEE